MDETRQAGSMELINRYLLYRYLSLGGSTLSFLLMYRHALTLRRLAIAVGIVSACILGNRLYKRFWKNQLPLGSVSSSILLVMTIEVVAYGLFIMISGGFFSPYLWYFISSFTIVLAVGRIDRRLRIAVPVSMGWCLVCAVTGVRLDAPPPSSVLCINMGMAFLLVAAGFFLLLEYIGKLQEHQQALAHLNESLRLETRRNEQSLQHTLELYEFFHLFGITDPEKVMEKMAALLFRTVAPEGCLLAKISLAQEMESICCSGLGDTQRMLLNSRLTGLTLTGPRDQWPSELRIGTSLFDIVYISSSSNIQGILVTPHSERASSPQSEAQASFYLKLVGIVMRDLDLHAMVESYIVSEEQNRIANELHDTVIQKLFSVVCCLRLLEERQGTCPAEETRAQLHLIIKAVESTMRELREAIYGLRWESDGQNTLADKLTEYLNEIHSLSGAEVYLDLASAAGELSVNQKTALYRIICEAVNNAIRHGNASRIDVCVKEERGTLITQIHDNGLGFDCGQVSPGGHGLRNMRTLTSLLSGHLTLESCPGAGTTICCSLPKS